MVLWQTILFAEGFLSCSGIDGQFGPATTIATKKWQSRYYLAADGQVGPATWAMADQFLNWQDSQLNSYVFYDSPLNAGWLQFYRGDYHKLHDGGAYELIQAAAPDGAWASFDAPRIHFHQRTITRFVC